MIDPQRILGELLGQAVGGGLGRKRKRGGSMIGKAQLGIGLLGIAMAAWEHYQGQRQQTPAASPPPSPGPRTPPPPPPAAASAGSALTPDQQDAMTLVRVMIAAAQADGNVDADERKAIVDSARGGGLDAASLAQLERELAMPIDLDRVLHTARDGLAEDLYTAALLAIRVDTPAERAWLEALRERSGLSAEKRDAIHQRVGVA